MNCPYSTSAWTTSIPAPANVNQVAIGRPRTSATVSLTEFFSQACAVLGINGRTAIQSSRVTNGMALHQATSMGKNLSGAP